MLLINIASHLRLLAAGQSLASTLNDYQIRVGNAIASIFFAVLLVVPLGFLNVRMLEDYGLAGRSFSSI